MFCAFKLSFDADIFAFFNMATVLLTFQKIGYVFPNLVVTSLELKNSLLVRCKCDLYLSLYHKENNLPEAESIQL